MADITDNTVVDGRYRIAGHLGSGGMADVFRADDVRLGRQVALKVLHRRFAQDEQFVERFRREAHSAAGLQHRHVVSVYDRGRHDGTYYIAMELLEGRSLKQLMAEDAPLSEERAVDLGVQVLEAAGFAHAAGVVHRDFKPQNVIVDEHDQLKVTDFGIARAGTSEITETGSIMGTAQYLSPEQAQGHAVTETSDLYSIGVMLYEMLSGELPFDGDSAVAIAVQHLNEPPRPLSELRPDIDPALESVVMRALGKDPAHRWESAEEFASALDGARRGIDPGPPALLPPAPAQRQAPIDREGRTGPIWIAVALLLLAIAALVAFFALRGPAPVTVPDVRGQPVEQASVILERAGLASEVALVPSSAARGVVIAQNPNATAQAEPGSTVRIDVSSGPGEATVPSVRELSRRRAVKKLNDAGFRVEEEEADSTSVEDGLAIKTVPGAGERIERGSRLRLLISTGPKRVEVPQVVGLSRRSAVLRLEDDGLEAVIEQQESDADEGEVISQDPEEGSKVDEGSQVTLVVSSGQPSQAPSQGAALVPRVTGMSEANARSRLTGAGYDVRVRSAPADSASQRGVVVRQSPRGGSQLARGQTVTIFVGSSGG